MRIHESSARILWGFIHTLDIGGFTPRRLLRSSIVKAQQLDMRNCSYCTMKMLLVRIVQMCHDNSEVHDRILIARKLCRQQGCRSLSWPTPLSPRCTVARIQFFLWPIWLFATRLYLDKVSRRSCHQDALVPGHNSFYRSIRLFATYLFIYGYSSSIGVNACLLAFAEPLVRL